MQPDEKHNGPQDLLQDLDDLVVLNEASKGQRFANYIIDLFVASLFAYFTIFILLLPVFTYGNSYDGIALLSLAYVPYYGVFVLYYTVMEAANKGRTVGKLLTGTSAVTSNGRPLTWKTAFYRSLCRIVPFEPFSGLGAAPWHDQWTQTTVVKN